MIVMIDDPTLYCTPCAYDYGRSGYCFASDLECRLKCGYEQYCIYYEEYIENKQCGSSGV